MHRLFEIYSRSEKRSLLAFGIKICELFGFSVVYCPCLKGVMPENQNIKATCLIICASFSLPHLIRHSLLRQAQHIASHRIKDRK